MCLGIVTLILIAPARSQQTTYTISASAGANGSISPSGAVDVNAGASQIFTLTPNNTANVTYTPQITVDGSPEPLVNNAYNFN